ncbi:MAG: hypothetical protein WC975_08565 [Phycisphaerae bacterium]
MLKTKPIKPYPTFPLTTHPNGQWCKKIRGKIHFFGVWADPEAADLHAAVNHDCQWYQVTARQSSMYAITFFPGNMNCWSKNKKSDRY